MKQFKLFPLLMVISCGMLLPTGCKKDNSDDQPRRVSLTNGKWMYSAYKSVVTGFGSTQTIDTISVCAKDDFFTFSEDNILSIDAGSQKCDTEAQVTTTPYQLSDDGSKLTLIDSAAMIFNVEDLTSSTLKISYSYDTVFGGFPLSVDVTMTMKNVK